MISIKTEEANGYTLKTAMEPKYALIDVSNYCHYFYYFYNIINKNDIKGH
jgi:ribosomal protein L31